MKQITTQDVLNIWSHVQSEDISVYIHSPFCKTQCSYCVYRGITSYTQDDYTTYYEEYLPSQIDFYSDVLQRNYIKQIYFGGGTPSLMKPQYVSNILQQLPHCDTKIFEIHPAFYSKELLDVLEEQEFSTIIIGIQSFDKYTLTRNNRPWVSYESIKNLIEELKSRDFSIAVDMLTLIYENPLDMSIFQDDLEKIFSLTPDIISVNPYYQLKNDYDNYSPDFLNMILEYVIKNEYHIESELDTVEKMLERYNELCSFRVLKNNDSISLFDERAFDDEFIDNSDFTLGIGSFRNRDLNTFSKTREHIYFEKNIDNKQVEYFATLNTLKTRAEIYQEFSNIISSFRIPDNTSITTSFETVRLSESREEMSKIEDLEKNALYSKMMHVHISGYYTKELQTFVKYLYSKTSSIPYIDIIENKELMS